MARVLYELVGTNDLRFSPYCWRTRMALAHKGLDAQYEPCKFTDKEKIAFSGQDKVPVLVDGDTVVSDSWQIAKYLENAYPDAPSLFDNAEALTRFVDRWDDAAVKPVLIRLVIKDVFDRVHPDDRDYFRRTREERFGQPLEQLHAARDQHISRLKTVLKPLQKMLAAMPFIAGETPSYADYSVFGTFQWARCTSSLQLLAEDDPIYAWRERMLDLFDGYARQNSLTAAA